MNISHTFQYLKFKFELQSQRIEKKKKKILLKFLIAQFYNLQSFRFFKY